MEIDVCDYRYDEGFRIRKNGCCPTIKRRSEGGDVANVPMAIEREEKMEYRIRKLTPRECWRLMGFADEDFDKAKEVVSESQLYKQAGNSIVVDVLVDLFRELL